MLSCLLSPFPPQPSVLVPQSSAKNLLHPADSPIRQLDLDAVRVGWRRGEELLYDADRPSAGPLIVFLDDRNRETRTNVAAVWRRHSSLGVEGAVAEV
jgi:hypothetical protein